MIRLGYAQELWKYGIQKDIIWDLKLNPHMLVAGGTGGGKTVFCQLVCKQILEQQKEIYILDFKAGGDWDNIVKNYYEFYDVELGFNRFYDEFEESIRKKEKCEKYLIFDEFNSYFLSLDSKKAKDIMAKLSKIAFLSRSFGYHIILISQQFSAQTISTAIREQFGVKAYIHPVISVESARMYYPSADIDKSIRLPRYCGFISSAESDVEVIRIPCVSNVDNLKKLLIAKGKYTFCED